MVTRLERAAFEIGEVCGFDTTRNLATMRIFSEVDLQHAESGGFDYRPGTTFGLHVLTEGAGNRDAVVTRCLEAGGKLGVVPTLDRFGAMAERPPDEALRHVLKRVIAQLFQVESFVDYHPDDNPFVSRLDVFAVADVQDGLGEAGHLALQRELSALIQRELEPLFREHKSNIFLTHLVGLPVLNVAGAATDARRLLGRYRSLLERTGSVPARFLYLDDRSMRYVVDHSQMEAVFGSWLDLLVLRRAQRRWLLRDLVHPRPDVDRLRVRSFVANNSAGLFGVATAEAGTERILRYCRNRQAIAMLNVFLGRPQDGKALAAEERDIPQEIRALLGRYGDRGEIAVQMEDALRTERQTLEGQRMTLQRERGLGDWGLQNIGLWEHQDNLVERFHDELDGGGTARYTDRWLAGHKTRMLDFREHFVERFMGPLFRKLEQFGGVLVSRIAREEAQRVDDMLAAHPAGWKDALFYLEDAVGQLDARISHWASKVQGSRLNPPSLAGLKEASSTRLQFRDVADTKPLRRRAVAAAVLVAIGLGTAVGAATTLALPLKLLGVGIAVPFGIYGAWHLVWRLLQARNAEIHDELSAIISKDDCKMKRVLDGACDMWFKTTVDSSWVGQRVAWSAALWRLRVWRRLRSALNADLQRLKDIEAALIAQMDRFREDQEDIGVRYRVEDEIMLESTDRVLDDSEVFHQRLVPSECLDPIYINWYRGPLAMAEEYLLSHEPFEDWRTFTPFTDYRELTDYNITPFEPFVDADIFRLPATCEQAGERLAEFLGDFSEKLSLHGEALPYGSEVVDEDNLVLVHEDNTVHVLAAVPERKWTNAWRMEPRLGDRHRVTLLRHMDGLLPWEIKTLGTPHDQVRAIIDGGDADALPKIIGSYDDMVLRAAMAITALRELATQNRDLCAEICRAVGDPGELRQRPVDADNFAPVAQAPNWVEPLAGTEGLLGVLCLAYGSRVDASRGALAQSIARADLLVMAADGQPLWALKALLKVPEIWRHGAVAQILRARLATDTVLTAVDDHEIASGLKRLESLRPEALRASTLVKTVEAWMRRGEPERALQVLNVARIIEDDGAPPLPAEYNPDLDRMLELMPALQSHQGFAKAMLSVYASRGYSEADQSDPDRRMRAFTEAAGGSRELLRLVTTVPQRYLDPGLVQRIRQAAL